MVVIAERVIVRELLGVGCIALKHVVEGHGSGSLARRSAVWHVVRAEWRWLRLSVHIGPNRDFGPSKKVRQAAAGICWGGVGGAAVFLLPHLVEAMYRAVRIGVVREGSRIGDLERTGLQRRIWGRSVHTADAAVGHFSGQAAASDQQRFIIGKRRFGQPIFRRYRVAHQDPRRMKVERSMEDRYRAQSATFGCLGMPIRLSS
jgi:hypothetical protein